MAQPYTWSSISPLSGSTRKFITPACDHCRRRKLKCDGSRPCSRCRECQLDCVSYQPRGRKTSVLSPETQILAASDAGPSSTSSRYASSLMAEKAHEDLTSTTLRYHVVLAAPAAMVPQQDETPITYLSRGRTYSISVTDQASPTRPTGTFYRSHVRISFDDETRRRRPEDYWQAWSDKRSRDKVYIRDRRSQAVEFVADSASNSIYNSALVDLEFSSHDSFCVLWYPSGPETHGCSIALRLNFLSTDFDLDKGVESVPVRLCVKTEMRLGTAKAEDHGAKEMLAPETCFCKVKLFSPYGARKKQVNDITYVKKSMEKIQERMADAESSCLHHRPSKRAKFEWQRPPGGSTGQDGPVTVADISNLTPDTFHETPSDHSLQDAETIDDLQTKLANFQSMLMSTRPTSILNLVGQVLDDPDLTPVRISQEQSHDTGDHDPRTSRGSNGDHSPASLHSQNSRGSSPPRASSVGSHNGHITPETIPFQAFKSESEAYQDELYQPSFAAGERVGAMPPGSKVNEYLYTPIQPEEVRLMVLYPGNSNDPVMCGLKVMPLHRLEGSQLVYQALSYAWGPRTGLRKIWVEDVPASGADSSAAVAGSLAAKVESRVFYVRPNLHAALQRLRSEIQEFWFWIDAICIDQEDAAEKSHQLPKMLDIYCNAWSVCIWLGEVARSDSLRSNGPLDLIGTIINLKLLDNITEASTIDEEMMLSFIAFAKLLKRSWFRRRWVIQEVSSSTRASVQYGHNKVNWIDFADAVQLFVLKLDRIRALFRGSRLSERDADALSHVEATGASAIVQATSDVLRKGEDGKIVARLCDIESLVMRFVQFEASDPRDTIFALLSLAEDGTMAHEYLQVAQSRFTTSTSSYMQPCESIYMDFIYHCIRQRRSLDIICRHWALPISDFTQITRPPGMRSWIGTTENSPFGMHLGSGGRMNGDSLVGAPGRKIYNASRNEPPVVLMLPSSAFHKALRVTGIVISRVLHVSPRIVDGTVPYDALRLLGWHDRSTVNSISERLWRTLVADRTSEGSKAPSWWRRACMFALSMASRDGDLSTQRLLQNKSLPQTVHEYLHRVQAMVWNRKIFAMEPTTVDRIGAASSSGVAGLGPRGARQGDCVCILIGCSVPVLLREVRHIERRGLFEFVGECFIYGMMDGEALENVHGGMHSLNTEFNLV